MQPVQGVQKFSIKLLLRDLRSATSQHKQTHVILLFLSIPYGKKNITIDLDYLGEDAIIVEGQCRLSANVMVNAGKRVHCLSFSPLPVAFHPISQADGQPLLSDGWSQPRQPALPD